MSHPANSHTATLNVACPECGAKINEYCLPEHKEYEYDSPVWTHKARHTAYGILQAALPKADLGIFLRFNNEAYKTDPELAADVAAIKDGVLMILGRYGKAWALVG